MITTADHNELNRIRVQVNNGWQVETIPLHFHRLASGMMQAEHRALDNRQRLQMVEGATFLFPDAIAEVADYDRLMKAWEESTKN